MYVWDVTSDHSDPEWSADHGCPDFLIPDISANFAALRHGAENGPVFLFTFFIVDYFKK